jgi:hypothetical protein
MDKTGKKEKNVTFGARRQKEGINLIFGGSYFKNVLPLPNALIVSPGYWKPVRLRRDLVSI